MADDWPQWRGPTRDGISQEGGLAKQWPPGGPQLVWQVQDLGDGYSTPAIVSDRLYVISSRGMDNEFVQCLSAKDGKTLWTTKLGAVGPNSGQNYPGARSTPTIDGGMAYCLGSDGDLACLDAATGKAVWTKNLRKDFGGQTGRWAYAESPLVDGNALVCTPGGSDATIVALDKKSGATLWKAALPDADQAAYASAIVVEAGGVKQYVQMLEKGLASVEAKTGKLLWRYGNSVKGSPANIPTPVAKDAFVYSATGRGGAGLVHIKASGADLTAEEVYFTSKLPTAIGGAVVVGNHLYGTNTGGLICADFATGEVKWQERGVGAGSVCFADGLLVVHGEQNGEVALVAATPEAYRELGRFAPSNLPTARLAANDAKDGKAWAYPAIANGKLFIRDWNCLWCYDISGR